MKKILVAVDGSDKSLEAADYAISIADKERAQLIILNVLDTEPWLYGQSVDVDFFVCLWCKRITTF